MLFKSSNKVIGYTYIQDGALEIGRYIDEIIVGMHGA